ncbi:hypothetical protein ACHAXT_007442 [Thalassiosira profunda]
MNTTDGELGSTETETKQQRKEEGRRRALEIALAKQKLCGNPSDDAATQRRTGKRANRNSARHGARNQHRHKHFAKWILERFPHVLEECVGDASNDDSAHRMHILDVAGGKGELSARLSLCHSLRVVMVDPRPADVASVYTNSVVPKLPNKWQRSIEERLMKSPTFVQDELDKRFTQLVMPFVDPSQCAASSGETSESLDNAVSNTAMLVALHADGATEAIVDAALSYGKPFVVVPCCVFPNLFRERYITVPIDGTACESSEERSIPLEKRVPVRTHDQFCKYLLSKDPRFVMEALPFEGRNIAIWWDGK